jgi:hypothetical protein
MGGWGGRNPWPLQWGQAPSQFEALWTALRKMLGRDGPGPEDGLEDGWRQAKVTGLLMAHTMAERAAMQALPQWSTDHIEVYESILNVPRAATDKERREAITSAWTLELGATVPALTIMLQAIDSGLDIVTVDEDWSTVFQQGKAYAPHSGSPTYGTLQGSQWPNYSTHFVLKVEWSGLTDGLPDAGKMAEVERALNTALPSWVDYTVQNDSGFYLDGYSDSYLDLTAFD